MSIQSNVSNTSAQEYEEYESTEGYDTGEYYEGTSSDGGYSDEGYQDYPPPPPPPPPPAPKKGKKKPASKKAKAKKAKAKKAKAKKAKAKKGKAKKGAPPRRRPPAAGTPPPPPPPPPPGYQETYTDDGYGQIYDENYPAPYPQDEYYPVQDEGVVIEDQAMIETVVEGEEDEVQTKSYQRKTDDPIYTIEEKIDRMLMGKELSLTERFQRKFGEELVLDEEGPMTTYTKRDMGGDEEEQEEEEAPKKEGPVPKKKEEKAKKVKVSRKDKKDKKDKKKDEKAKKPSRFGIKFGGGEDEAKGKKKKKKSPADIMKSRLAAAKPKPRKVAKVISKSEPEEEPDEHDEGGMELEDFISFKQTVDDLLGNLPEDELGNFTGSEDFKVYERVGTADDFTDEDNQYVTIVDDLLAKLPEEVIQEFMGSDDFELYQKVVEWGSE